MVWSISTRAGRGHWCGSRFAGFKLSIESASPSEIVRHGAFSMKRPIVGSLIALRVSLAASGTGLATDTVNQDADIRIDPYGDGSMKIVFHLSASRWAIWRQEYGD